MCIIIDTNTISYVFNINDMNHQEFKPVLDWIISGPGKIVMGGSKYRRELNKMNKYIGYFLDLERNGKVFTANRQEVDNLQKKVEERLGKDCDDPHIIAILIATKCRLLCSVDKRLFPFIKNRTLYPKSLKPPKAIIYSGKRNKNVLCDNNIAEICK